MAFAQVLLAHVGVDGGHGGQPLQPHCVLRLSTLPSHLTLLAHCADQASIMPSLRHCGALPRLFERLQWVESGLDRGAGAGQEQTFLP